jgi:hypothetical protein
MIAELVIVMLMFASIPFFIDSYYVWKKVQARNEAERAEHWHI